MTVRPRRSALYMPGSNARAMEKAKTLDVDAVIFDLEDAVAADSKVEARARVVAAVQENTATGTYGRRELVIRVNGLETPWGQEDLQAVVAAKPSAVLLPKVASAQDVRHAADAIAAAPDDVKIWAMIESPMAILNIKDIAAVAAEPGTRLSCFILGLNDLVKDTRAELDAERTAGLYWLSATVTAARAYGVDVLDSVYNDFNDAAGFARECAHARMLGMDGKSLIHPAQIEAANQAFSPAPDEVAWARKILEAFQKPENANKGVINLDGKMVELLHAEIAKRTVAIADAIGL